MKRNNQTTAPSPFGGPQIHAESGFEAGKCSDVGPGFPVDDTGHRRVGDAALAGDSTGSVPGCELAESEGELAGGFGSGFGALLIGPVGAERPGSGSGGAGHNSTVGNTNDPVVHTRTKIVTPSDHTGAWKHQYVEGVRPVADRIDLYIPRIPAQHWSAIADFVRDAVREAEPTTTYTAGPLLSIVTALTHWSWKEGQPLERRVVFDRWNIERFIASGSPSTWTEATRGNSRSILFRASETLLGHEASTGRVAPLKASLPLPPYTDEEVATFRGWATTQVGDEWHRSAMALLALGLGAGLTTQDLGVLRRHHIDRTNDGTFVINVPAPRERQTIVFADWEDDLAEAIADLSADEYVFRRNRTRPSRNIVTGLIAETTGLHKPEGQRLRATWIVRHLCAATPVQLLMSAAGLTTTHLITRYLAYIPPVTADDAVAHMRFGRRT